MAPTVKILFLESSLELVPRELHGEPDVIRSARRYEIPLSRLILDKSLHYKAMRRLEMRWKRGRPDIIHMCLLLAVESPLTRRGVVEVYFHVLDGRVFKVRSDARLPKHLERFKGVMSDLLIAGKVPVDSPDPLIFKVSSSLEDFLAGEGKMMILWEKGELKQPEEIVEEAVVENAVLGIGAFPRGDFKEEVLRLAHKRYAIAGGHPLTAWSVTARLVCELERRLSPINSLAESFKKRGQP
jgi:rRNA small subunit pseudouridine methyltransferase Nep1